MMPKCNHKTVINFAQNRIMQKAFIAKDIFCQYTTN